MNFLALTQVLAFSSDVFGDCCVVPIIGLIIGTIIVTIQHFNQKEREKNQKDNAKQEIFRKEQELAKYEAERVAVFQENSNKLLASPDYNFIEQFARKYGNKGNNKEALKLQMLLESKHWKFSLEDLNLLVNSENKKQRFEIAKSKILMNQPYGGRETVEAYLNYYQSSNDEMLEVLAEILREKGLYSLFNENLSQLKKKFKR